MPVCSILKVNIFHYLLHFHHWVTQGYFQVLINMRRYFGQPSVVFFRRPGSAWMPAWTRTRIAWRWRPVRTYLHRHGSSTTTYSHRSQNTTQCTGCSLLNIVFFRIFEIYSGLWPLSVWFFLGVYTGQNTSDAAELAELVKVNHKILRKITQYLMNTLYYQMSLA